MEIEIGDFKITSDPSQFTLWKKEMKGLRADTPGEIYDSFCGYYSDLPSCLNNIPRHLLLRSDCASLLECLNLLKEYKDLVNQQFAAVKIELPKKDPKPLKRTK